MIWGATRKWADHDVKYERKKWASIHDFLAIDVKIIMLPLNEASFMHYSEKKLLLLLIVVHYSRHRFEKNINFLVSTTICIADHQINRI